MTIAKAGYLFFTVLSILALVAGIGLAETSSIELGKQILLTTPAFGVIALAILVGWVI